MDKQPTPMNTPPGAFDYGHLVQQLQEQSPISYARLERELREHIAAINAYSGYGSVTIAIAKSRISRSLEGNATGRTTKRARAFDYSKLAEDPDDYADMMRHIQENIEFINDYSGYGFVAVEISEGEFIGTKVTTCQKFRQHTDDEPEVEDEC